MATDRQLDDRISRWLEAEAPVQLPDRVLRATFERTRSIRQQVIWRGVLRRMQVQRFMIALSGAAVVLVIAALALGIYVNGPRSGVGGPGPSPATSPSTTTPSSPTVAPQPSSTISAGFRPRPFVLWDGAEGGRPITVTLPSPGWSTDDPGGGLLWSDLATNANGDPVRNWDAAALIAFHGDLLIPGHPCQWRTTMPDRPATTVDDVVDALASQALRDASEPVDITVDGYSGKSITLHVPEDIEYVDHGHSVDFPTCDARSSDPVPNEGRFCTLAEGDPTDCYRWHQGPGQIDEVWVVDVAGEVHVIDGMYGPDTPADNVAELRTILDSISFGTP